jgi:polyribonucleotide nucleotidyltransferase
MDSKEYSIEVGGKTLTAVFNNWADQTSGSLLVKYGNSVVLATAVMGMKDSNLDYFPLSVEYEERFYAAGAILGSQYVRREGKPSDEATLSGRMVDRTIRPLFPSGLKRDVQVIITVLALEDNDADVLAINAASLALAVSNIPWNGPASAVRLGLTSGPLGFIINPTYKERTEGVSTLDLLACGKDGLINMIEVGAAEVTEDTLASGLARASEEIEKIQAWQKMIVAERGVAKWDFPVAEENPAIAALFEEVIRPQLALNNSVLAKEDFGRLQREWNTAAAEQLPDANPSQLSAYYEHAMDEHVHVLAIKENKRVDGRAFDEIRPLSAQAGGISPVIHGTGLFFRGATHVLAALTLGGPGDAQTIDSIESRDEKKRFMLHYNFPPYSVGETGRMGGTNRRMIGHGALAR